jgi:iron complex transport system substrate-binding protein
MRLRLPAIAIVIACLPSVASMQPRFVDDAGRTVSLPARVGRVMAAGTPAEVMLYTLVPDFLVGRNRLPDKEALEFYPPAYRNPVSVRQLPEVDNPAADAELIALKPDVFIDYGTVDQDYVASIDAVQRRTRVPGVILSGELARIPEMYRRLGTALGVKDRGDRLGGLADRVLKKYRGVLSSGTPPVRVYLACSNDGYQPCLEDDSGGEQLKWLGGVNVAGTRATAPRRPLTIEEIAVMAPDVIVVSGSAARLQTDPAWQQITAVTAGRVYQWPSLPYGWGSRPPSVNRLPGVAWLAYVARGRSFDAAFEADLRSLFRELYHINLTAAQIHKLLASS